MPTKKFFKKILPALPIIFVISFSVFLYLYVDAQNFINFVGLENAYLLMFLVAFAGGLTTFNFIPYYSVIILLVSAGLSPLYVGLASAAGVMCGDTFSYFLGYSGTNMLPESYKNIFRKISVFAINNPKKFILASFVYGSVSPFSNDFITISSGIAHIPYRKVMVPLVLGNFVFNISLAYLAVYGYQYLNFLS